MKLYLAVPPEAAEEAGKTGFPLAWMGARTDKSGRLFLREGMIPRGKILAVDIRAFSVPENAAALAGTLMTRIGAWGFRGLLLETEKRESAAAKALCRLLVAGLCENPVYITGENAVPGAYALTETAVTGGTLEGHLRKAIQRCGGEKTVLDVQRLRREFVLPAKSGNGRDLTGEELRQRINRLRPAVHYSRELCAQYFPWNRGRETVFVLFDDASSLRRKLRLASGLGIECAFLFWPEVKDLLPELPRPGQSF